MKNVLLKIITNNLIFYKITMRDLIAISEIVTNIKSFDCSKSENCLVAVFQYFSSYLPQPHILFQSKTL